jgi:hypothetical protein
MGDAAGGKIASLHRSRSGIEYPNGAVWPDDCLIISDRVGAVELALLLLLLSALCDGLARCEKDQSRG